MRIEQERLLGLGLKPDPAPNPDPGPSPSPTFEQERLRAYAAQRDERARDKARAEAERAKQAEAPCISPIYPLYLPVSPYISRCSKQAEARAAERSAQERALLPLTLTRALSSLP